MIEIEVPGYKKLRLEHLVLDYNGTIAVHGDIVEGVKEKLESLSERLRIHVLTADTFGMARSKLEGLPCHVYILPIENQEKGKLDYAKQLGLESSVCIGNGRNDRLMLKEAALGIAVILEEGTAKDAVLSADLIIRGILPALELLENPLRLIATLRS
jgi:soluble P-type ATPase